MRSTARFPRWLLPRLLGAGLLTLLLPMAMANAVLIQADKIDADGTNSTIDLWFISFSADTSATLQIDALGGPPVVGADTELVFYEDDGTFSNIFASATGPGSAQLATTYLAGSYIAVVANGSLASGEFGPFQPDTALAAGGYDYEFAAAGADAELTFNCRLSGRLSGGYDKTVINADTCQLPPTAGVSEPGTLPLLALALIALGWIGVRHAGRWRV